MKVCTLLFLCVGVLVVATFAEEPEPKSEEVGTELEEEVDPETELDVDEFDRRCRRQGQGCNKQRRCCRGLTCNNKSKKCERRQGGGDKRCQKQGQSCNRQRRCCQGLSCNRQGKCARSQRRCRRAGQSCRNNRNCCRGLGCNRKSRKCQRRNELVPEEFMEDDFSLEEEEEIIEN